MCFLTLIDILWKRFRFFVGDGADTLPASIFIIGDHHTTSQEYWVTSSAIFYRTAEPEHIEYILGLYIYLENIIMITSTMDRVYWHWEGNGWHNANYSMVEFVRKIRFNYETCTTAPRLSFQFIKYSHGYAGDGEHNYKLGQQSNHLHHEG